ncbi:MAG: hypothetical protein ABSH19_03870 [Opitutales bacterium]|jgi:hypothetical protein
MGNLNHQRRILVVIDNPGRLGNLITRHAHLLAHGIETGDVVMDYSFLKWSKHFPNLNRNLLQGYPMVPSPGVPTAFVRAGFKFFRKCTELHRQGRLQKVAPWLGHLTAIYPRELALDSAEYQRLSEPYKVMLLEGYLFTCRSACTRQRASIRRQFHLASAEFAALKAELDAWRAGHELVGVHIRHGDFREYDGGRFFFTVEEYAATMRAAAAALAPRRLRFVVCSDEPQAAESFAGMEVLISRAPHWQDLIKLSLCDRLIGTMSTFVRTASFLREVPLYTLQRERTKVRAEDFAPIQVPEWF